MGAVIFNLGSMFVELWLVNRFLFVNMNLWILFQVEYLVMTSSAKAARLTRLINASTVANHLVVNLYTRFQHVVSTLVNIQYPGWVHLASSAFFFARL